MVVCTVDASHFFNKNYMSPCSCNSLVMSLYIYSSGVVDLDLQYFNYVAAGF